MKMRHYIKKYLFILLRIKNITTMVVVAEKHGTAQKNARHYIGKEAATNKNVENCFSLLQSKLGMTGW